MLRNRTAPSSPRRTYSVTNRPSAAMSGRVRHREGTTPRRVPLFAPPWRWSSPEDGLRVEPDGRTQRSCRSRQRRTHRARLESSLLVRLDERVLVSPAAVDPGLLVPACNDEPPTVTFLRVVVSTRADVVVRHGWVAALGLVGKSVARFGALEGFSGTREPTVFGETSSLGDHQPRRCRRASGASTARGYRDDNQSTACVSLRRDHDRMSCNP